MLCTRHEHNSINYSATLGFRTEMKRSEEEEKNVQENIKERKKTFIGYDIYDGLSYYNSCVSICLTAIKCFQKKTKMTNPNFPLEFQMHLLCRFHIFTSCDNPQEALIYSPIN